MILKADYFWKPLLRRLRQALYSFTLVHQFEGLEICCTRTMTIGLGGGGAETAAESLSCDSSFPCSGTTRHPNRPPTGARCDPVTLLIREMPTTGYLLIATGRFETM
jgi:hypothetical protein